jgi:hypothetical protein
MALQTTRLQGIAARDENREAAAESSLFNQTSPSVSESLAPGTELQAAINLPRSQKFATLAESQMLAQQGSIERARENAIRQQAQLALQERGQQFSQDLALRTANRQDQLSLAGLRQADQAYETGQLGLQKSQFELDRNQQLMKLYGPTMKRQENTPVTKEVAGYYISSARSALGIPNIELRDEDGNLTPQGSDYLDAIDVISKRNPEMSEADRIKEAAKIAGLRSYDQTLEDIDDEIASLGTPEDETGQAQLATLQAQKRAIRRQNERRKTETEGVKSTTEDLTFSEDGQLSPDTVAPYVQKAKISLLSKNPEERGMAFDALNKLSLQNVLTPEHKSALYDSVVAANSGGDESAVEARHQEMLKNSFNSRNQKIVFDAIRKQYTDFIAPKGTTQRGSAQPRSSLLVPMSQQERGSYSPPSERSITDSISQQLGIAPESAKALYQKILLEQLKAEDFDNIFERGDAVSARKIAIENLLNSYLNGNK